MNQKHFLSDFVIRQFDIKTFKEMIHAFISLIDNFQRIIDKEEYYIKLTPNYEVRVGGNLKPTHSKVESFIFKKYDEEWKMEQLLLKFKVAFNSLNEAERKVFIATFVDKKTNLDLCEEIITYYDKITIIRKSAIVRFCLKLGFEKLVDEFRRSHTSL